MGLPVMNVIFTAAAQDSVRRSDRGTVGMILVDDSVPKTNPVIIYKKSDIPETLSKENQEQIDLALKGYVNSPSKIIVFVLSREMEEYNDALNYFSSKKVSWLCCPTVKTDNQVDAVSKWVKEQRDNNRNKIKAVLPDVEADCEGIVDFATSGIPVGEKTYTAEQYCSRIAGLLAGTPAKMGATYAPLNEISEMKTDKKTVDSEIDAGKFVLYYDGEKAKVARAVNSLKTATPGKADSWKKIKVVETMDMISEDLTLLAEDNYIGKYTNIYANKCLLLNAIKSYFKELVFESVIEDYEVDLDVDAIRDYIVKNKGVSRDVVEAMKDDEVKKQYTDEKVFLKAKVTIADVMEDIDINITV